MPYAMVPAFYARLGALGTVDARALQWTILTGARASEAIGAHDTRGNVRKAYQRLDQLEQRRPILQKWSDYLTG
jgi:hypothetical protein